MRGWIAWGAVVALVAVGACSTGEPNEPSDDDDDGSTREGCGGGFSYGGAGPGGSMIGLCEPCSHIFCRCPNGAPGTKECNAAGTAFSACQPCIPRNTGGSG